MKELEERLNNSVDSKVNIAKMKSVQVLKVSKVKLMV